ncbi:hypothetical protein [Nitrosomonas sp.]|uniref:hypothetical protein n=1 Tax=Nitrosomonas sp. TaxID=42353 RepID=UPI0026195BDF|nr:hypothetical protein [Nitrosomonas sp.]
MNTNPDRLYELLPAIYRIRDAEQGEPLKALLQVISEQVNLVEADIAQLYENWFIETCEDWVVPYIADLIGYQLIHEAGEPADIKTKHGQLRNKILIPRREVANTIRYRKRKGTLALLELLANDMTGWPARAVEFYQLLGWTQSLNHLHLERGQTVNLRNHHRLEMLGSPFDESARTVDVRRINSNLTVGCHNIPSVGVFVWRLKHYSVTQTQAYCVEGKSPHCFTFNVLGNDTPLFINPEPETDPTHIADEFNLPVPMRRSVLAKHTDQLYGNGKDSSFYIWIGVKRGKSNDIKLEPLHYKIIPADLSGWQYLPSRNSVAIDSVLGRIAFSPQQIPRNGVWVSYHYGFGADIGGGEYDRQLLQHVDTKVYRVNQAAGPYKTIAEAIQQWEEAKPAHAIIEIGDSRVYVEPIKIEFAEGHQSLQLRAANEKRPVIRLLDWQTNQPDALTIIGKSGEHFSLDGVMVTGRGIQLSDNLKQVTIRHSTLVPGWSLDCDCQPECPTEPSLEIFSPNACVVIEHSILGSIQINPTVPESHEDPESYSEIPEEDEQENHSEAHEVQSARCEGVEIAIQLDPIRLCISDSIVDATSCDQEAIGGPGCPVGYAVLTMMRSTVFGQVQVHAIELGENCIFEGLVTVARRQYGCMRFSYVTPDSRTPPRYMCQPDLAEHQVEENLRKYAKNPLTTSEIKTAQSCERIRVKPLFDSVHYGMPTYCQLALNCAQEIKRGADDESEMGVFHHLFQPQREANLRIRLDEYVPAGSDVSIIFAS